MRPLTSPGNGTPKGVCPVTQGARFGLCGALSDEAQVNVMHAISFPENRNEIVGVYQYLVTSVA